MVDDLTEQLFGEAGQGNVAVLEERKVPESQLRLPLLEIKEIIRKTDGVPAGELIVSHGTLAEGTNLFIEVTLYIEGQEVYYDFSSPLDQSQPLFTRIARVGKMSPGEALFQQPDIVLAGSSGTGEVFYKKSPFLKNNQAVGDEGEIFEAEYIALYQNGEWYAFDPQDREKLNTRSRDVLGRLKPL